MAITIPILTDFDGSGISKATRKFRELEGFGAKAHHAIRKAALPAAAAVAAVGVAAIDAVKGAMEDEAAQVKLAGALQRTTGASASAIAATEDFITKTSMAAAVSDDELRPALATLARGTGDLAQAQKGLGLALDIAASTGKPVEAVSVALAKAYAGQESALAKLDPTMKAMVKNGASTEEIFAKLTDRFGGAAADAASTAEGRFRGLSIALDETKESVGAALLPVVEAILPVLQRFGKWAQENPQVFLALAGAVVGVAVAIGALNVALNIMALSPAGLAILAIVAGIAALSIALVTAYQKSETFRNIMDKLGSVIRAVFSWINEHSGAILEALKVAFTAAFAPLVVGIRLLEKAISLFKSWQKSADTPNPMAKFADDTGKADNALLKFIGRVKLISNAVQIAVRGARQNLVGLTGSFGTLLGQRAGAASSKQADQLQKDLDAQVAARQKADLEAAVNSADTEEERVKAVTALNDFNTQQQIKNLREQAEAESTAASDRVASLTAAFNAGTLSAEQFRIELDGLIGASAGEEMGAGFASAFSSALADVVAQIAELTGRAGQGLLSNAPKLGNINAAKPKKKKKAKKMASGGIVTQPTFALIGEAGPEAVIPLNRSGGMGMGITINVQAGLVSSPDQIGQQIIEAIQSAQRRSGPVFAAA